MEQLGNKKPLEAIEDSPLSLNGLFEAAQLFLGLFMFMG